jgi:hypothetical protein
MVFPDPVSHISGTNHKNASGVTLNNVRYESTHHNERQPSMNRSKSVAGSGILAIIATVCCIALAGCIYEVPITAKPTRKVDERLLGDWTSKDGKEKMNVRKVDDFTYIVLFEDEFYRAYHSDVAKTPFVSVQNIDSDERKYSYMTWKLSEDGNQLGLRMIDTKLIPKETKSSAAIRKLLTKHLDDPELLEEEALFIKNQ